MTRIDPSQATLRQASTSSEALRLLRATETRPSAPQPAPELRELVVAELAKPPLKRRALELQALYQAEREQPRKKETRMTMWLTVTLYIAFACTDYFLIPDVALVLTSARCALSALALILVEILVTRDASANIIDTACATLIVAGYLVWLVLASDTAFTQSLSYYMVFGTIFMMVANLLFNFSAFLSIVSSLVVMGGFFAAMMRSEPASLSYEIAFGVFYVSCFAFHLCVNWKLSVERYAAFLNALLSRIQQREMAEQSEALLKLSNTDSLTEVANRRSIDETMRRLWREWQLDGKPFAAILTDIDFFKRFNDHYGHQEGDCTLVAVANTLARLAAPHDAVVGRYGGEEFIVLVQIGDHEKLRELAESIRSAVADLRIPHDYRRDGETTVTVSVGAAATVESRTAKLERLISEADRALYNAKARGRNCVQLFDPSAPHIGDEAENIAAILRVAIERDQVSMVYQPIKSLATGKIEAVEALMRLKMPDGTLISPALFIPVAESSGAIHELGRWAIRTACQEALIGQKMPVVSINISAIQLQAPGFSMSVAKILGELGVAANRIAFEITEGLDIEDHDEVLKCINELQQLGIRIWLDDFGTGFAGLSWLRLVKFDMVKIDRSFLHDSVLAEGADMLKDIIALIRNRGHTMIVEGVETEWQMDLMRRYRVDQVQGFYVGRPVPAKRHRKATVKGAVRVNFRYGMPPA
ncbi:putative bifunctional diguanylate cyclase/phosphodiesterase [Consotaella salsifontis]|uniref:Diguanylate cyclase/phosphodiesterase n=1 Tax=Consotaella salsifontis TaxID=1365950 RepID=A0A1T4T4N5_9HYPH|nr:EAL domain-containing protein [Consotaella salsifontis]SKA35402.1 diguanylate cyclase/phosphodiesterase [Consotaella salsifontis]